MTTIRVYRLTDDDEFEQIGRIEGGEIVEGKNKLAARGDREVWEEMPREHRLFRFNGPRVVATRDDEPADQDTAEAGTAESPLAERHNGVPLSSLSMTRVEMEQLTHNHEAWVSCEDLDGGEGWRDTDTGRVVYDDTIE